MEKEKKMEAADIPGFEAARGRLFPYNVAIIEANGFKPMAAIGDVCMWSRPLPHGTGEYEALAEGMTLIVTQAPGRQADPETYLMNPAGKIEEVFYGDWIDPMVETVIYDPAWNEYA